MGNSKKLMVIGWDAADWDIIYPLIKQGKMPTLAKFLKDGSHGNLATLNPPLSPMLWTTIATGKRAYDHGILGFTEPMPDGSGVRPVNSTSRKVKAIWNILNQNNYTSNVIGWWPSYPAEPINGVMVSNFYQLAKGQINEDWPLLKGCIHPESYSEKLKELRLHPNELTAAHILPFVPMAPELDINKENALTEVVKSLAHASSLHNATTYLAEETDWDFLAVYHDAIDHMCHAAMKYHPPQLPGIKDEDYKKYRNVVESAYRFHDMMLERMLDFATEDTTVMIISDHGFHSDHLRPLRLPKEPAAPALEHSPYGIFAIKGPGIKKSEKIYGASLLDITPTMLTLFDLPIAEDMEGRPLLQIFEKDRKPKYIDSWEKVEGNDGAHKESDKVDPWASQEAMKQLVDLGYVEKPDADIARAIEKTKGELQYNLARTYADTGKHKEAIKILEILLSKTPENFRYYYYLIQAYTATGNINRCSELIEKAKLLESDESSKLIYFEGLTLLAQKKYIQANEKFQEASKLFRSSSSLNNQIGKAYRLQEKWEDALTYYETSLKINPKNAQAYHGRAICLLKLGKVEEALEDFFIAIELLYFFPHAHYYIGECFVKLKLYKNAAESFEIALSMAPKLGKARKFLVDVYKNHLNNPEKSAFHENIIDAKNKNITVVSGLPRSGTSMLMQMLDKGGMNILTDKKREADESNPKGYYEYEKIKSLKQDASWMDEAIGKVVKIVSPLLTAIPDKYHYKVIVMERSLHDVLVSQQVMLGKTRKQALETFPFQLAANFQNEINKVNTWIEEQPYTEILKLNYNDIIENPRFCAEKITKFLNQQLDIDKMVEVVDEKLNRSKLK